MVDITKCSNSTCPKRHECYRYMALDHKYLQAYRRFEYDLERNKCEYFYKIEKGRKIKNPDDEK